MAPAFALHAVSGGLNLMNIKGEARTERVALPVGADLDFQSETLEQDVRDLLKRANLKDDFEGIRKRHGPKIFQSYQKFVAILLVGIVFGGILIGLMAKIYRLQTIIAVIAGVVIFVTLAL